MKYQMNEGILIERLAGVDKRLTNVEQSLRALEVTLTGVKVNLSSMHLCSRPDMCVSLDSAVVDHESRLRRIEKDLWKLAGATGIVAAILALAGQFLLGKI